MKVGDRVKITKQSSQQGNTAVVTDPDWTGRVKVSMDGDGAVKSYLLSEISFCVSDNANSDEDDKGKTTAATLTAATEGTCEFVVTLLEKLYSATDADNDGHGHGHGHGHGRGTARSAQSSQSLTDSRATGGTGTGKRVRIRMGDGGTAAAAVQCSKGKDKGKGKGKSKRLGSWGSSDGGSNSNTNSNSDSNSDSNTSGSIGCDATAHTALVPLARAELIVHQSLAPPIRSRSHRREAVALASAPLSKYRYWAQVAKEVLKTRVVSVPVVKGAAGGSCHAVPVPMPMSTAEAASGGSDYGTKTEGAPSASSMPVAVPPCAPGMASVVEAMDRVKKTMVVKSGTHTFISSPSVHHRNFHPGTGTGSKQDIETVAAVVQSGVSLPHLALVRLQGSSSGGDQAASCACSSSSSSSLPSSTKGTPRTARASARGNGSGSGSGTPRTSRGGLHTSRSHNSLTSQSCYFGSEVVTAAGLASRLQRQENRDDQQQVPDPSDAAIKPDTQQVIGVPVDDFVTIMTQCFLGMKQEQEQEQEQDHNES